MDTNINIHINGSPIKKPMVRLPWPRLADDNETPVGIDIKTKRQDIIKIVYKYFKVPGISMDELLQEVFATILHKNHGNSAHDPRKSSFGHYVHMIANNVCINFISKKKRLEREKESLDFKVNDEDDRTILDTYECIDDCDDKFDEKLRSVETQMRMDGEWELARYIRVARSGSKPDVVREALSWGDRKITTKYIRDVRCQVEYYVNHESV